MEHEGGLVASQRKVLPGGKILQDLTGAVDHGKEKKDAPLRAKAGSLRTLRKVLDVA